MNLAEHPTVRRFHESHAEPSTPPAVLDATWLRQLCLDCGADDAGLVEIGRAALDDQRADILRYFPAAKTLLSFVCRMNRGPIRSPAHSASNLEFHATYDHSNEVARRVVAALEARGIRAMNPSAGFPMEMARFPGKIWVVGHKPVAVAAGLGRMGIHRNVIHPKFGTSSCWARCSSTPRRPPTGSRSTTTRASSASCAWRRARSGRSRRTAASSSRAAPRTTTASS
jgi:hypothetical protein